MFGLSAIENEDYSTADALMEYKDHSVDHISLEDEVFMNPKLFSLKETALWKKISDELRKRKEKMIMKRKELESEIKTPTFIRKKDKYAFTIGVILTVCTTLIAARFSYLLPPFYLFWAITVNILHMLVVFSLVYIYMSDPMYFIAFECKICHVPHAALPLFHARFLLLFQFVAHVLPVYVSN